MGKCNEKERTYIFDNTGISIKNVTNVDVSASGGHRITTADGVMVYVAPKWLAIEIDSVNGWEF